MFICALYRMERAVNFEFYVYKQHPKHTTHTHTHGPSRLHSERPYYTYSAYIKEKQNDMLNDYFIQKPPFELL